MIFRYEDVVIIEQFIYQNCSTQIEPQLCHTHQSDISYSVRVIGHGKLGPRGPANNISVSFFVQPKRFVLKNN